MSDKVRKYVLEVKESMEVRTPGGYVLSIMREGAGFEVRDSAGMQQMVAHFQPPQTPLDKAKEDLREALESAGEVRSYNGNDEAWREFTNRMFELQQFLDSLKEDQGLP